MCLNKRTKNVHAIDDDGDDETCFLGEVSVIIEVSHADDFCIKLRLDGKSIKLKLDTGADVTVIPAQ